MSTWANVPTKISALLALAVCNIVLAYVAYVAFFAAVCCYVFSYSTRYETAALWVCACSYVVLGYTHAYTERKVKEYTP